MAAWLYVDQSADTAVNIGLPLAEVNHIHLYEVTQRPILSTEACAGGAAKITEIAYKEGAIKKALGIAAKGDTVLITGMGHEIHRIVNGRRILWNDAKDVREILTDKK